MKTKMRAAWYVGVQPCAYFDGKDLSEVEDFAKYMSPDSDNPKVWITNTDNVPLLWQYNSRGKAYFQNLVEDCYVVCIGDGDYSKVHVLTRKEFTEKFYEEDPRKPLRLGEDC